MIIFLWEHSIKKERVSVIENIKSISELIIVSYVTMFFIPNSEKNIRYFFMNIISHQHSNTWCFLITW